MKIGEAVKNNKYHTCIRKKIYTTAERASVDFEEVKSKLVIWAKDSLMVYQCPFCDFYHIGKHPTVLKRSKSAYEIKRGMRKIQSKLTKKEKKILGRFIGYIITTIDVKL